MAVISGLACLWAMLLLLGAAASAEVVITSSERKVNLKSQIAKVTDNLEVLASGAAAESLLLCYPTRLAERQARLRVTIGKEAFEPTPATTPAGAPSRVSCYSATISIPKDASATVEVSTSFTGVLTPNPRAIRQGDQQLVEYEDTLWPVSPYKIQQQSTTAILPTEGILSHSRPEDTVNKVTRLVWGSLGAAEPWSLEPLRVHFHHDKPFKKVVSLVREIEVSHWGNIYVEEAYVIANAGSEHKGPFSRLRYQLEGGRANSFQDVRAHLPAGAHSLYYKDAIGNISSSHTRKTSKETVVDINLRYPLMGGWKTDFIFGYSLPLEGALYRRPKGRSRLILDLSSPLEDVVVESLEVRVVLPEGSTHIKPTLPFDMDVSWDKKFTYLDTAGRPVLVLRKSNLTPAHNKPFAVDYSFGVAALLREPLLLISAFAALFAAVAVYHRLELTIAKDARWHEARAKERAAATLQLLSAIWDDEASELDRLAAVTEQLADAAGVEAANGARQAAEARLRALDAQARPLLEELEGQSPKAAAAARDLGERGRALQLRAAKLVSEKCDHLRRGASALEAAKRVRPAAQALADARADWAGAVFALCD